METRFGRVCGYDVLNAAYDSARGRGIGILDNAMDYLERLQGTRLEDAIATLQRNGYNATLGLDRCEIAVSGWHFPIGGDE